MPTLNIIRGLPGSGKTTVGLCLMDFDHSKCFEADKFFMIKEEYNFIPEILPCAHDWCKRQVESYMKFTKRECVVSNTFTQKWEYQPYLDLAEKYGYDVQIIECHGKFKSVHNVPDYVIQKMKERWEPTII